MGEVSVKHQILGRILCVATLSLISFTVFIALLLSAPSISATTTSVPATVRISSACSLGKTIDTPHEVTLSNGNYSGASGYGQTTLKAFCNDAGGFSIYAIGYTSDEYGNTTMHWNKAASSSDNTNAIPTEVYDAGNMSNSSWSMKLSALSGTYAATIDDGVAANNNSTEDFTSWHEIPETYTRVAYRLSGTDTEQNGSGTGSSITVTYDTYITPTQPAGSYTGQVKFTLVHPSTAATPEPPIDPLDPELCPANSICYAPNSSTIEGDMSSLGTTSDLTNASPKAGVQSASDSTVTLIAPNYKREGYGFAGWSTEFDATTATNPVIYGPNETISTDSNDTRGLDVSGGAVLYPVWIAKETGVTMQTFNSTNYSAYNSAPNGTVIALEDERDHDVYAVAKLADGKWWMIENLRLDDSATLTVANTHNPLHDANNDVTLNADGTFTNHLAPSSSDVWCYNNSATCYNKTMLNTNNIILAENATNSVGDILEDKMDSYDGLDDGHVRWYGYGNYYNWYAATAGNGTYSKSSGFTNGDLCPINWRLPQGGEGYAAGNTGRVNVNGNISTYTDFYYLGYVLMGVTAYESMSINGTGYYATTTNSLGETASKAFRKYPNNFVFSGHWEAARSFNRNSSGRYWSSSANSSYTALKFNIAVDTSTSGSISVFPGTISNYKTMGLTVRCVAGS